MFKKKLLITILLNIINKIFEPYTCSWNIFFFLLIIKNFQISNQINKICSINHTYCF